jgi:hypothetical protein
MSHTQSHTQSHPAGPLWQEYVGFLSGPKPGTPAYQALWATGLVGGQEESTRTAALR